MYSCIPHQSSTLEAVAEAFDSSIARSMRIIAGRRTTASGLRALTPTCNHTHHHRRRQSTAWHSGRGIPGRAALPPADG